MKKIVTESQGTEKVVPLELPRSGLNLVWTSKRLWRRTGPVTLSDRGVYVLRVPDHDKRDWKALSLLPSVTLTSSLRPSV